MTALKQQFELKEEVMALRNAVEEMQFETRNMQGRQQDLYRDLNRRMSEIERNQGAIGASSFDRQKDNGRQVVDNVDSNDAASVSDAGLIGMRSPASSTVMGSSTETSAGNTQDAQNSSADEVLHTVSIEEQQVYDKAFDLLKKSRYADSIATFQQLTDSWPNSQLADDAIYWMSEARYVNREFEQALSGFRSIISKHPDSQRVPEALLKIGYIQYDIGTYDDAAATFRDILTRFPGHQVALAARTRLGRIEKTEQ